MRQLEINKKTLQTGDSNRFSLSYRDKVLQMIGIEKNSKVEVVEKIVKGNKLLIEVTKKID